MEEGNCMLTSDSHAEKAKLSIHIKDDGNTMDVSALHSIKVAGWILVILDGITI